ncbi:MAG: hypothetical protein GY930_09570 [bacterium]|nr:hypothetical protein [bacterium]
MPASVVEPVRWQYQPERCTIEYQVLAHAVHVAGHLQRQIYTARGDDEDPALLKRGSMRGLCLRDHDLDLVIAHAESKIDEVLRAFNFRRHAA